MENMESLLENGRAAEKDAKQPDRDGLAVHLHKRGGAPIRVRAKWIEGPEERILRSARLILADAIPGRLAYDLGKLADVYENWSADSVAKALRQDALRIIRDKQPRSGRESLPEIEEVLQVVDGAGALRRFARELLVARQFAAAARQAGERAVPEVEAAS
jgi:CRISPR-associated protein Cmr2